MQSREQRRGSFSDTMQSDMLGESKLRRRLFMISNEQKDLLARDDAWVYPRAQYSKANLNVPAEVLRTLKEHHFLLLQAQELPTPVQDEPDQASVNPMSSLLPAANGGRDDMLDHLPTEQPASQSDDDDVGEREDVRSDDISWHASPEHHKYPPQHEASGNDDVDDDNDDDDEFMTQLPENSPPQPTAIHSFKRPLFDNFPPSSLDQEEEELELDMPVALEPPAISVNKEALHMTATPPSAQIVPCTFQQPELSPEKRAVKPRQKSDFKQPRYVKVAELYRPPNPPENKPASPTRGGVDMSGGPSDDSQPSTFSSNSSSSIIPSTNQDPAPQRGSENDTRDIPQVRPEQIAVDPIQDRPVPGDEPAVDSTPQARSPPPPPLEIAASSMKLPPTPIRRTEAPFVLYCLTYPNYNGDIQHFVTACLYIQVQQNKIRSYLYDDFIRVWHKGYCAYVKECDTAQPPVKTMTAYAWYNEMDDEPLYTSRIVSRQNLGSIIDFYPDEVRVANRNLGLEPKGIPPMPVSTPTPHLSAVISKPANPSTEQNTEEANKRPAVDEIFSAPALVESGPNNLSPMVPYRNRPTVIDLTKSMSEVEDRREPAAKGLARSLSEVGAKKRKYDADLSEDVLRRQSTTFVPRPTSPSASSVQSDASRATFLSNWDGGPSSTDGRKRRYANNPKKRNLEFAKYLKKQKRLSSDTIMSSAPISNTPTSAQRQE